MPGIDQVTIIRRCSFCTNEIETMTVKKDNMMLSSRALVWCSSCEEDRPERRDIVDREDTVQREQASYPPSHVAVPFGAPPER